MCVLPPLGAMAGIQNRISAMLPAAMCTHRSDSNRLAIAILPSHSCPDSAHGLLAPCEPADLFPHYSACLRGACGKCSHPRMPWDFWLIFFVLGVILPWRGQVRVKKLLAMPHVSTMERLALYASTIGFQWIAVAVVAWRARAH